MSVRYARTRCEDCGLDVVRPMRNDRHRLCTNCAIGRVARNAYRRARYGQQRRAVMIRQRTNA